MVLTRAQRRANEDIASLVAEQHNNTTEINARFASNATLSNLPFTVRRMYQIVGDPCKASPLRDPHTRNSQWTLLSLDQACAEHSSYIGINADFTGFDIAYIYHGMGHIVVCSVDVPSGKMYYRIAGGADGTAAEYNKRAASSFRPSPSVLFDVSDWLADVRNNTPVDALLNVEFL